LNWRRWPDWRKKWNAVREAITGLWDDDEKEEAVTPAVRREALLEADRKSRSAQALIRDIREAHRDWVNAHRHFEYAAGFDQIDYAIYAIEAAEKRYEMLLRQAKKMNVHWRSEWEKGAGAG
jgi:hypothetical protein